MRRFTKDHNELCWLFPICDTEESASRLFDEIEEEAKDLLECTYNKESFDKDDMIDSFMKGYSRATRIWSSRIHHLEQMLKAEEMMSEKLVEKLSELKKK